MSDLMSGLQFRIGPSSQIIWYQIMAESLYTMFCYLEQLFIPVRREQKRQGYVLFQGRSLLMFHGSEKGVHLTRDESIAVKK